LQLAPPVMPDAAWLDEFPVDEDGETPDTENDPDQTAITDDPIPGVDERELAELLALRDAPTTGRFTAALSATATPFPHQSATIERAVNTFPRSYLYGDEVGLGKTVELGLTLRELLLAGTIERALILPPAAVITQWQDELSDLMNLDVPRWGNGQWIYPDGSSRPAAPGDPWSTDKPVVLVTSHLARRSEHLDRISAQKWDVVIVDEAHHARRREGKATGTPNNLLRLLQGMRDAGSYRALYLASATPMQMHPHEAWDLIELFGLPDAWADSSDPFMKYFTYIGGDWTLRTLPYVASLVQAYFSDDEAVENAAVNEMVLARAKELPTNQKALLTRGGKTDLRQKFVNSGGTHGPLSQIRTTFADDRDTQALIGAWLHANNPMRDRVFRNTRQTLRAYRDQGLWPVEATIPVRHPVDVIKRMTKDEEALYCRVQQYILTKYDQAAQLGGKEQNALGFILTVYRRRLTSSFHAIAESLRRRVEGLEDEDLTSGRLLDADDTIEEGAADHDEIDAAIKAAATDGELLFLRQLVSDLAEHAAGDESKMFWLRDSLKQAFEAHGLTSALIFTQYADTMHYIRDRLNTTYSGRVIGYSSAGGTLWDPAAKRWQELSKDEVKERFRSEEPHILVGTDTLAEGLNLQTCGWLVNWDMPWNFTRVEQRIGRIDRISGHENVYITNFFYDQTVEAKVYKKLRDTIGGFDAIVGISQPVLEDLADVVGGAVGLDDICDNTGRTASVQGTLDIPDGPALDASVARIINAAHDASATALAQLDGDPATATQLSSIAGWTAAVPLAELERALTSSPITARRFSAGPLDGTYKLRLGGRSHLVTFDRVVARDYSPLIQLLTWGTPVLDELFDSLPRWQIETYSYRELLDLPEPSGVEPETAL
jgi:superfamily II DNA or RNA helicase